jgi:Peptidase family M23
VLTLPFTGSWLAATTPARRVPSHGTHFGGQTYAIDFVAVGARGRTDTRRDWRSLLTVEPVQRFVGFGRPILAPADGQVVAVHDGEPDQVARRSPLAGLPYLLTQGSRLRRGISAVLGNHLILELAAAEYVLLAHLRAGSVGVRRGDTVTAGQPVAGCGNSGNSTQPHLHMQVMDSGHLLDARGLPVAFRDYLAWSRGASVPREVTLGVPGHRERVAPAPP